MRAPGNGQKATNRMFGTDFPLVSVAETAHGLAQLGFTPADFQKIARDNAVGLIPRLKA